MVARSHARCLGRIILIAVLATALPLRVNASPFLNGDDALQRYEAALGKGQEAMAKNDAAAIESLGIEAESALAEALEAYRDHYDATGDAGSAQRYIRVLRLKGDHDLAAEIAAETLDSGADSALLWREYGSALLTMGKKKQQEGIDALYESLKRDKTSPEAVKTYNELGFFYLNNAMPVAAASAFDAVLAMDSTDTQGQLGRLVVDVYNGDIGQAGDRLSAVGRDAQPYDVILRAQLRLALRDFDIHRRSFSDTVENHYAYARLLYSAARLPQAIMAGKRAARLAKTDIKLWNFLGAIQSQIGDYPGAQRSYEASLKANPDQPDVRGTVEKLKEAQQPAAQEAAPGAGKGPLR